MIHFIDFSLLTHVYYNILYKLYNIIHISSGIYIYMYIYSKIVTYIGYVATHDSSKYSTVVAMAN